MKGQKTKINFLDGLSGNEFLNKFECLYYWICTCTLGMPSLSISQKSLVLSQPNKYQQSKQNIVFKHIYSQPQCQHIHSELKISWWDYQTLIINSWQITYRQNKTKTLSYVHFHHTWSGVISASSSSQSTSVPSSNKVCTTGASPCSQALSNCRTRSMGALVPKLSSRFTHDCIEVCHSETYFNNSSHSYIRLFFSFIVIYLSLCSPFWFRSWRHFVPKCLSVNNAMC